MPDKGLRRADGTARLLPSQAVEWRVSQGMASPLLVCDAEYVGGDRPRLRVRCEDSWAHCLLSRHSSNYPIGIPCFLRTRTMQPDCFHGTLLHEGIPNTHEEAAACVVLKQLRGVGQK